jgi:hypothetical protein
MDQTNEVSRMHEPQAITDKPDTALLLSIPGLRESILEGMAANLSESSREPGW